MSSTLLVRRFARVTEAPNAIPRLRRFLIDLAVSGRLGDDPDEPISAGWPYAPLGELIAFSYGKGLAPADRAAEGPVAVYGSNGVVARTHTALAEAPSIIVGRKGSAGALRIADEPSWTTDVAYYIEPPSYFNIRFLFLALQSLRLESLGKGVKPGLSRSDTYPLLLPHPPLPDQCRMVAQVDGLMALCDELESVRIEREARRDELRTTSLRRLVAADASNEDARFFLRHSPRMITMPAHVTGIRQAILDLAVRGRLVPQDPQDEPAGELLNQVRALADSPPSRAVNSDGTVETFLKVPVGWVSARVSQLFRVTGGIQKQPKRTPRENAWPYVGVSNVQRGRLDLRTVARFELLPGELERIRLEPGDLLVVEGNGSPTEIGRCARWGGEIADCVHQNHIIRVRPLLTDLDRFALLYLNSPLGMATMRELAITTAGLYSLSVGKIQRITMPLPPLAEQHRIVAKVDELLAVCDELDLSLANEQLQRARLLEALLEDAVPERELELLAAR